MSHFFSFFNFFLFNSIFPVYQRKTLLLLGNTGQNTPPPMSKGLTIFSATFDFSNAHSSSTLAWHSPALLILKISVLFKQYYFLKQQRSRSDKTWQVPLITWTKSWVTVYKTRSLFANTGQVVWTLGKLRITESTLGSINTAQWGCKFSLLDSLQGGG